MAAPQSLLPGDHVPVARVLVARFMGASVLVSRPA